MIGSDLLAYTILVVLWFPKKKPMAMKKVLTILFAIQLCANTAAAQTQELAQYGNWQLNRGIGAKSGKPFCAVGWYDANTEVLAALVGQTNPDFGLIIAYSEYGNMAFVYGPFITNGQSIPRTDVEVTFAFDSGDILDIDMKPYSSTGYIYQTSNHAKTQSIIQYFENSDKVTITSPDLKSTTLDLSGSDKAFQALDNCTSSLQ